MKQEEYRACMTEGLKGKPGLSKEERQLLFCSQSKLCSQKATTRGEAEAICRQPKEPKPVKVKRQKQEDADLCDPEVFFEAVSQFKDIYINAHGDHCAPCADLDRRIEEAAIPYQIINVPEACIEILDQLETMSFPTVFKMHKGKIVAQHTGLPAQIIELMKRGE